MMIEEYDEVEDAEEAPEARCGACRAACHGSYCPRCLRLMMECPSYPSKRRNGRPIEEDIVNHRDEDRDIMERFDDDDYDPLGRDG